VVTAHMSHASWLEELSWLLKPAGGGLYLVSTGASEQKAMQRRYYGVDNDEDITAAFLANLARIPHAGVVMLGLPSDVGAGFRRGANLGPQALRAQLDALPHNVVDIGDVFVVPQLLSDDMLATEVRHIHQDALYPDIDLERRRRLPVSPLSIAERVWQLVFLLNPRARPMTLGGDHSCAWPAVAALHHAGQRFCIVQVDAHTDLLPHRLGVKMCFATWSFHANELIGRQQRLLQVGIRASRFPQAHWEQTLGVRQWWPQDVRDDDVMIDEVLNAAKATGLPCFFSNDIDGTDASEASATGTPEPGGLSSTTVVRLVERLAAEVGLVGADLMEVAPLLEVAGGATLQTCKTYLRATLDGLTRTR
jgi:arginase family enzyme